MARRIWRSHSEVNELVNSSIQQRARGPGHPELDWTDSRDRKLFRLIAEVNVPWKNIEQAMYECPVPGYPGQGAFFPSQSACRSRWKKMTKINPYQSHIDNLFGRRKHKERMVRAFEEYQKDQSKSNLPNGHQGLITLPPTAKVSSEISARSVPIDIPTPALTFEGATPVDFGLSVLTPQPQDIIQLPISGDESRKLSIEVSALYEAKLTDIVAPVISTQVSAGHDGNANSATERDVQQISTASVEGASGMGIISKKREPAHTRAPKRPPPTQAELDKLEKDIMGVPHGFLNHVKYNLTKSRNSIQSIISARRLSFQRPSRTLSIEGKTAEKSEIPNYGQYMTTQVTNVPQSQPAPFLDTETTRPHAGRPETDLFLELRMDGANEGQVAERIRRLLGDLDLSRAHRIVRARNRQRETALEVALGLGNTRACEVLLSFGADVNVRTSDGKSLSAFGRAARNKATTTQLYYAIGTCRNIIRSYEGEREEKAKRPHNSKKRMTASTDAGAKAKKRIQSEAAGSDKSMTTHTVPQLDDRDRVGLELYADGPQINYPRLPGSQESDLAYNNSTIPRATPSRVPVLVNYFENRALSPQQIQDFSRANSSQDDLPTAQLHRSCSNVELGTVMPQLPEIDPRLGKWERLPDNRIAFVLHSHNISLTPQEPALPLTSQSQTLTTHLAIPMEMVDTPRSSLSMANNTSNQWTFRDTRRHGIIMDQFGNLLNTVQSSEDFQTQTFQQEEGITDPTTSLMNNQHSVLQPFSNPYITEGYSSQVTTASNGEEVQLLNTVGMEQYSAPNLPEFMAVPQAELDANPIFSDETLINDTYVDGWDWKRLDGF